MKDETIVFETAKLAKEKGCYLHSFSNMYNQDGEFDSPYKETYPAYTQSLLQRWLREKRNMDVDVWCNGSGWGFSLNEVCGTSIYHFDVENNWMGTEPSSGMFYTYELALEQGLIEALNKLIF
jgi:hypothetical protein